MTNGGTIVRLLLLAALAACSGETPEPAGNEFRVAIKSDIRGTNPGVERDVVTDDVMLHVVEPLVTLRADLSPAPLLAETIDVSEDGRVYTFVLREGVRFHNGEPLTAREVKWTWDRILDPETGWLCRNWYDGSRGLAIEAVEVVDARTVRFRLDRANSLLLDRMANLQCNSGIIHPASVNEDGSWREPVGTGPYRLAEWRRGEFVRLEKFAAYRSPPGTPDGLAGERRPRMGALKWMIVPEPAAARAALLSGQVHLVYGLQASDLPDLQASADIRLHRGESLDWNVLLMQISDPLLGDDRIRRAVAMSLDVSAMAAVVTQGISPPNPSIVAAASRYHTACHDDGYSHDPTGARALLEEVGYIDETIVIQTNRRFQNLFDVALVAQNMLRRAGLQARLEVLEWTTQLDNYYNGNFQLMAFGYSGRTDPALAYEAVLGSRLEGAFFQWENPAALKLLDRSTRLADPAAREALFCEMHHLMLADVPFVNLFNHYVIDATRSNVQGYSNWPAQKPRLWHVELVMGED